MFILFWVERTCHTLIRSSSKQELIELIPRAHAHFRLDAKANEAAEDCNCRARYRNDAHKTTKPGIVTVMDVMRSVFMTVTALVDCWLVKIILL